MTTAIEWTDETWNPTTGCDRVSPGCDNCYALTLAGRLKRMGQPGYQNDGDARTSGPGFGLTLHPDRLDAPLRWKKPRRVFVNSMSDLFHPEVSAEFIGRVFGTMGAAERHTFQVLTKRPQRMAELLAPPDEYGGPETVARIAHRHWWMKWFMVLDSPDPQPTRRGDDPESRPLRIDNRRKRSLLWRSDRASMPMGSSDFPWPLPNVWLGTSIESDRYTFRADHLRATPAAVRFLSLEPLLSPLPSLDLTDIGWVIVGGESGHGFRAVDPSWVRDIRDRCVEAGVPFLFKQWGGRTPKAGGRTLDGRTWDEYPG